MADSCTFQLLMLTHLASYITLLALREGAPTVDAARDGMRTWQRWRRWRRVLASSISRQYTADFGGLLVDIALVSLLGSEACTLFEGDFSCDFHCDRRRYCCAWRAV
jgi:hypothetical protein